MKISEGRTAKIFMPEMRTPSDESLKRSRVHWEFIPSIFREILALPWQESEHLIIPYEKKGRGGVPRSTIFLRIPLCNSPWIPWYQIIPAIPDFLGCLIFCCQNSSQIFDSTNFSSFLNEIPDPALYYWKPQRNYLFPRIVHGDLI